MNGDQQNRGYWQPDDQPQPTPAPAAPPPANPHADLGMAAIQSAAPTSPSPQGTDIDDTQPFMSWEAAEYTHHQKNLGWFIGFILVVLVLLGISIWLREWTFVVLVVAMAVTFGVYALRPPHQQQYQLSAQTIRIDEKLYNLSDFRAFGVSTDGETYSIMLLPVRRFMPAVNVHFNEADGEQIVDILGSRLPMERMQQDLLGRIMRHLRF